MGPLPKKLISGLKQLYWGSLVQGLIRGLADIRVERADFKSIQSNKLHTTVYLNNLISCLSHSVLSYKVEMVLIQKVEELARQTVCMKTQG